MKNVLLAVDCSLRLSGVAVLHNGMMSCEQRDTGRRQAAELPLMVERVFEKSGCRLKDTELTAVTVGPGYFTGLRVGAAWVAALAYALGVKVVPVSSLYMLAHSCLLRARPVLAVVYAGRGFAYAASFGCGDGLPPREYSGAELRAWLERNETENLTVVSDDPERVFEAVELGCEISRVLPDASIAARVADARRSTAVSPMELKITYHRAPQGCVL